jgi:hypothetical protein
MAIYLIGYDLIGKPEKDYEELFKAIESLSSDWWHCLDSTWLIISDRSAKEIRDALWVHMHKDDHLLVTAICRSSAWKGFKDNCQDWLAKNL